MTQEKEAEVTTQEEVTQAPEVIDETKQQITELKTQLEAAKREAKSHQEYGRKQKEELDRQRGLDTKVSRLEDKFKVATDMLADLLDRESNEEEVEDRPKGRRSDAYREKLKQPDTEAQERERQRLVSLASDLDSKLRSIGMEMDKSPETKLAYALWRAGDVEAATEEVNKIVESKKTEAPESKENPEELVEQKAKEMFNSFLKERGLDKVDTGTPIGGTDSWADFQNKYIAGDIPFDEYEERAQKEGKLL